MTLMPEAARTRSALAAEVAGPLYVPGDPELADEVSGYNLAVQHDPVVVVGAIGAEDVAAAVRFAGERDLPVSVLATGHGAVAAKHAVLITTRRMRHVHIDPDRRLARVGAGVKWEAVIDRAAAYGLAPLVGSTPDAGIVGYTLGGGMPVLGRTFGWAADQVQSMEVVTADGQIRHVDAQHDPDLFWALRGGKGGFGVVTAMEFSLLPLTEFYGGGVYFDGGHSAAVLHTYRAWVRELPAAANSSVALLRLPDLPLVPEPLRGRLTVHLRYAYVGDAAEGARLFAPMRDAAPALIDTVEIMPHEAIGSIHNDPTEPMPAWDRGILLRDLPEEAVDVLLDAAGPQADVPLVMVEIRHLGAALMSQPVVPSSAGGRDAQFAVTVIGPLPPPLASVVPAIGNGLLSSLTPWSAGTHANFAGGDSATENEGLAWDPATYQRLQHIKRRYDPADVFRSGYTVRPTTS